MVDGSFMMLSTVRLCRRLGSFMSLSTVRLYRRLGSFMCVSLHGLFLLVSAFFHKFAYAQTRFIFGGFSVTASLIVG